MTQSRTKPRAPRKRVEQLLSDDEETRHDEDEDVYESTSSLAKSTPLTEKFDSTEFAPAYTVSRASVNYADTNTIYPLLDQFADDTNNINLFLGLTTFSLGVAVTSFVALITAQTSIQVAILATVTVSTLIVAAVFGALTRRAMGRASRTKERLLTVTPVRRASKKTKAKRR